MAPEPGAIGACWSAEALPSVVNGKDGIAFFTEAEFLAVRDQNSELVVEQPQEIDRGRCKREDAGLATFVGCLGDDPVSDCL